MATMGKVTYTQAIVHERGFETCEGKRYSFFCDAAGKLVSGYGEETRKLFKTLLTGVANYAVRDFGVTTYETTIRHY